VKKPRGKKGKKENPQEAIGIEKEENACIPTS